MEPRQSHHIYNHANGTENIFEEEKNDRFFLQQYAKCPDVLVDNCVHCLMPNHFHLLVGVRSDLAGFKNLPGPSSTNLGHVSKNPVAKAFSDFFNSYTKSLTQLFERKGSLFIENVKRTPIRDERQWQEAFLYIHLNPIKRGFVDQIEDWKWSGWHAYQHIAKSTNVNRDYYLNLFDGWVHVKKMMVTNKEWLINKELE